MLRMEYVYLLTLETWRHYTNSGISLYVSTTFYSEFVQFKFMQRNVSLNGIIVNL
jgi:hypothetical protein